MELSLSFDHGALLEGLDDIDEAAEAATRPAAHQAALVFYKEVRAVVAAKENSRTGKLLDSIYRAFDEDYSYPAVAKSPGYGRAFYNVSWNAGVAHHGHLVEDGHWLPFVARRNSNGSWYTVKRDDAEGEPPSSHASQADKDAYWLRWPEGTVGPKTTLKMGVRWVKPYKFIQIAFENKYPEALRVGRERFFEVFEQEMQK
jgi:hypothetical protein